MITQLPPEEQAEMEEGFAALASELLEGQPEVKAEYERLHALVEASKAQ